MSRSSDLRALSDSPSQLVADSTIHQWLLEHPSTLTAAAPCRIYTGFPERKLAFNEHSPVRGHNGASLVSETR